MVLSCVSSLSFVWNSCRPGSDLTALCKCGMASSVAKAAADAGASVLLSNHSEYDGAYTKARLLSAPRQPGEDHPFIAGTDGVQRYFTVMVECATASKLRAEASQ